MELQAPGIGNTPRSDVWCLLVHERETMRTKRMSTRFGAIGKAALVAAAICAAMAPLSSQADTGPLNGTPDDVRVAPLVTAFLR